MASGNGYGPRWTSQIQRRGVNYILANQKDIHCAQVEFVEERKSRETLFRRMHTGVKLSGRDQSALITHERSPCNYTPSLFSPYIE